MMCKVLGRGSAGGAARAEKERRGRYPVGRGHRLSAVSVAWAIPAALKKLCDWLVSEMLTAVKGPWHVYYTRGGWDVKVRL
jgi:hypothetical protein